MTTKTSNKAHPLTDTIGFSSALRHLLFNSPETGKDVHYIDWDEFNRVTGWHAVPIKDARWRDVSRAKGAFKVANKSGGNYLLFNYRVINRIEVEVCKVEV